jgi:ABC-type branched-subunit amino acid transport system ATPase component
MKIEAQRISPSDNRSEWLWLDEPTAGLDPRAVESLVDLLLRLKADGMTLWIVEHNRSVVAQLADHVAFMADGLVLADGPADQILHDDVLARLYLGV